MKNYTPLWKTISRSVRKEYEAGATVHQLSIKHKINPAAMRQALIYFGTKMRPPGSKMGPNRWYKLTKEDIDTILKLDDEMVSHSVIGRQFNVSRERIRQICQEAGHATRTSRLPVPRAITLHEERLARKAKKQEMIQAVSEAWRSGMSLSHLGLFMKNVGLFTELDERHIRNGYVSSKISWLRMQYGKKMFPYRMRNHWRILTPEERAQRILDMAKEWNTNASIWRIKDLFGYANYNSANAAFTTIKNRYPDLFKSKKLIQDEAVTKGT